LVRNDLLVKVSWAKNGRMFFTRPLPDPLLCKERREKEKIAL
jgi:hypothetical protein